MNIGGLFVEAGNQVGKVILVFLALALAVGLGLGWLVSTLRADAVDDFRLDQAVQQSHADQELRDAQAENAADAARGDVRDRLRDGGAVFAVPGELRNAD